MAGREPVPLLIPDLPSPQQLMPYLQRMHDAQLYSNFGPLVRELENRLQQRFAQQAPVPVALSTVANATMGLELVLMALRLPAHSRILLPSLTFVATATAVLRAGHIPVLADVDIDSWLLTPEIARRAAREVQVDAVMPVAAFGAPQAMAGWHAFEQETGIPVVVDAAGAFGSQWLEAPTGTAVFSLHATKSLPAGEGGFVVSSDAGLVARVRQLSNFGINLEADTAMPVGTLASIGSNAKMSEYHAAVGLASLDVWDARAAVRRGLYAQLQGTLDDAAGAPLRWQAVAAPVAAPTLLCLRLATSAARTALELECARSGIATRRWYQPLLGRMLAVTPHCVCLPAPNATLIATDMCGLPFFAAMSAGQQQRVAQALHRTSPHPAQV
ncbi:DegT/DnrJ/EryC1/StrS aminotransferase [Xylophilus sp. Kf1]|nr:DegT/DnrJ/EryC1/StrS aminotransferase [Xylophilus sp. Kf1]